MIKMKKEFIPKNLYKKIVETVPMACVDLVVKRKNSFLMLKRKENPAKDKWWFPGGRVFFNESLNSAVRRKLKEEINIKKPKKIELLGVGETKFKKGRFNKPYHSINSVFLAEIKEKEASKIKINSTSSNYKWFQKIPKGLNPYLKHFLGKANFK